MTNLAIRGDLVHTPVFGEVELLKDHLVVFSDADAGGKILALEPAAGVAEALHKHGVPLSSVWTLQEGEFVTVGFVDTHLHAPQYSYTGTATDKPLMGPGGWLEAYTFPRESRHSDIALAKREYGKLLDRLLKNGTTTALYFATLRLEPTLALAQMAGAAGQRAFVGKVAMDRHSPEHYVQDAKRNLGETEEFITGVRAMGTPLVQPVITPRFVPTCSPELLHGLGELASRHSVMVQSHISESMDEVDFVEHLHPEAKGRDATILDSAGLLKNAVMAHAVCLTDDELHLLAARGTAIAHCPLSNFFFGDKLLHVCHCLRLGVKVGLGSDVAGGYAVSMLAAIRSAVIASKALRMQAIRLAEEGGDKSSLDGARGSKEDLLDWRGGLWLATMGGAQALGIQDRIGSFAIGKEFDALIITTRGGAAFDVFEGDTDLDAFEKFVNLGDDRNIKAVFVQGRQLIA